MTINYKWCLAGLMLLLNNEIVSWLILTVLVALAIMKFAKEASNNDY